MQVIVVGGGIAGLALALSLHQAGIAVRIYEAVGDLEALGVGINLQPTAVRELTELGLAEELAAVATATEKLCYFNKFGQLIHNENRGIPAGYKWPQYSIHRGRLQLLMLRAARQRLGPDNVRTGLRLTTFEQNSDGVTAEFRDSRSGGRVVDQGEILVGADGIHSTVRRHLHPTEGKPRFAQQILWRAATDGTPFLGGHTMIIAGHFHQRVVAYPIGPGAKAGRSLINWICQMTVPGELPSREDWNRRVAKANVMAAFGTWRFPWLDVPALIDQTKDIYEFPLVDRDPISRWTQGCVTLIGDAAHPMQPIGSQAGSQAIIDARVLTASLLALSNPTQALERYDELRRPIMTDITLRNRRLGPEAAMQLVEERAPNGFACIDDVISPEERTEIANSFAAAAGLDAETVNTRPSFVLRDKRPPSFLNIRR